MKDRHSSGGVPVEEMADSGKIAHTNVACNIYSSISFSLIQLICLCT